MDDIKSYEFTGYDTGSYAELGNQGQLTGYIKDSSDSKSTMKAVYTSKDSFTFDDLTVNDKCIYSGSQMYCSVHF